MNLKKNILFGCYFNIFDCYLIVIEEIWFVNKGIVGCLIIGLLKCYKYVCKCIVFFIKLMKKRSYKI